jgi:VCBS repeat-containing protein
MQPDGSFSYDSSSSSTISSLVTGEQVIDSFTYTASDNAGGNRQGNVQITVTGTNEHPWQNETLRFDVDNSGRVTNGDALIIISRLRRTGAAALPVPPTFPVAPPPFYDVNGDDSVSLIDAIEVVRFLTESLNARNSSGEGEGESIAPAAEKASSQSIVSSANTLQPVKLAARNVQIEEVAEAPAIDLFLASGKSTDNVSPSSAMSDEDDDLDLALDSIATDVGDAWE